MRYLRSCLFILSLAAFGLGLLLHTEDGPEKIGALLRRWNIILPTYAHQLLLWGGPVIAILVCLWTSDVQREREQKKLLFRQLQLPDDANSNEVIAAGRGQQLLLTLSTMFGTPQGDHQALYRKILFMEKDQETMAVLRKVLKTSSHCEIKARLIDVLRKYEIFRPLLQKGIRLQDALALILRNKTLSELHGKLKERQRWLTERTQELDRRERELEERSSILS